MRLPGDFSAVPRAARCGRNAGDRSQRVTCSLKALYIDNAMIYFGAGRRSLGPLAKRVLALWQFMTYSDGLSAVTWPRPH